jgi:hypothetical protein
LVAGWLHVLKVQGLVNFPNVFFEVRSSFVADKNYPIHLKLLPQKTIALY